MEYKTDKRALSEFIAQAQRLIGSHNVFDFSLDRDTYCDQFAFDPATHRPAGAVAPANAEEVRSLVQLANRTGTPLWPISRGKNLGYGGSAPRLKDIIVLDLSRLNRIIEIDTERGYCVVEPGVSFFDLYDRLKAMGMPLWMSVPGNAWGSVAGNALERGMGPQPYGDHAAAICGLEVILPDASLMRTGAGAMANSRTWHLTHNAYGPSWDQFFCQSNFGVITKLGLWLMAAPEATMTLNLSLPDEHDLAEGIEMLQPLRLRGVLDTDVAWISYVGIASYFAQRSRWYEGTGPLPGKIGARIRKELNIGWWNAQINLYGHEELVKAKADIITRALRDKFPKPLEFVTWRQGEPIERCQAAGIPSTRDMEMISWLGGRGGHIGFSPILPADGRLAAEQYRRAAQRYAEFGIDYYGAFGVGGRSVLNINEILYNRDDASMAASVPALMSALIGDAAKAGFCEYRTHLDEMDRVAATFDYNNHILRRTNEAIKDVLDPRGILAPGKQGIWPRRFRDGFR